MKVLISGGSGLLGKKLSQHLLSAGYEIAWLGRKHPSSLPAGIRFFPWNPEKLEMDSDAAKWSEAVINLAGASIGETNWNAAGRKEILQSRLQSVRTLNKYFAERTPLQAFTGISGAGYYGKGERAFTEDDKAGEDFPAQVAAAWEMEYQQFQKSCMPEHFCLLRLGVVLSADGGALPKILQPFQLGVGSELGNGRQPFNWIHETDAIRIIQASLDWDGIFNASAPAHDSNSTLCRTIAQILNKPLFLPSVPAFVLRILLGDRASLVLEGNYSDTGKVRAKGFEFSFPDLRRALNIILNPKK